MHSPMVDHHIQTYIVDQLFRYGVQSFSSIKPTDVENSLFMYHMKKLIARNIVERCPKGFQLTAIGIRWANQSGESYRALQTPRLLVQLFALQNNQILISERTMHLATHTSRYMLPGGIHQFGKTALENAKHIASKFSLSLASDIPIGTAEFIDSTTDHHGIVTYYQIIPPPPDYIYHDDVFVTSYMPVSNIQRQHALLDDIIKQYNQKRLPFTITLKRSLPTL